MEGAGENGPESEDPKRKSALNDRDADDVDRNIHIIILLLYYMQIQFDGITTEDLDECVICLEGVESEALDGKVLSDVSEIPNLVTTCQCRGHVHRDCIRQWTSRRPVCPFCNHAPMYFIGSPTNSDEEDRVLVRQKCCANPILPGLYAIAAILVIIIIILIHI